jgi:tetratricopeptide (TPR) repeat protein
VESTTRVRESRFGSHLRTWRVRSGISLRDLAKRVHVDYGHLGKIERGSRAASRTLVDACDTALEAGGALRIAWMEDDAVGNYKPAQLPSVTRSFVGRDNEVRYIEERLTASRKGAPALLVVTGPPGVGKTALVLRCANEGEVHFPDGTLFADLRGYSDEALADPHDVLEQFLLALGVPASSVPHTVDSRASLYRSVLNERRVLVVLDNAGSSEQVRQLLPGGHRSSCLVTSRARLSGLTVRHGALAVDLTPLRRDEAVDVLRGIVGARRVDAEPAAAVTLAVQCSCLPLALCVAAERVAARPRIQLANLVEELANETEKLDLLSVSDDTSLEVRRAFSWSYRSLHPDAAYLFRMLGLFWGSEISLPAAAAIAGWPVARTRQFLDLLTGAHLLQEIDLYRYCYHDLLRVYATELAKNIESEGVRRDAVDRLLRWYLAAAHVASQVMAPYRRRPEPTVPTDDLAMPRLNSWADAVAWYELELPTLTAATKHALGSAVPSVAHQLPIALWDYFFLRKPWAAWNAMNTNGLKAARAADDRAAEAWMLYHLGVAHLDLGELDQATEMFAESLRLRKRLGDRSGQGWCLLGLGNTEFARGSFGPSTVLLEDALAVFLDIDDRWSVGICRGYLGAGYTMLNRFGDALRQLTESENILRDVGDQQGEGCALDLTAKVHLGRGHWREALDYLNRAIELRARIGDRRGQASTMFTLGKIQQDRGQLTAAAKSFRAAFTLFTALGDPEADTVRACMCAVGIGLDFC